MTNDSAVDLSFFTRILEKPLSPLLEKSMDEGRIPIGYTCSFVPEVLLSVQPLFPVRLRAPMVTGTEIADIYLSSVTCSYTRSLLEAALDDQFHFLQGWVFAAGCDHMRRLYDNLNYLMQPDFIHIIDAPHRLGNKALAWYTEELRQLTQKLSKHLPVDFSRQAIEAAIETHNTGSSLLDAISRLRQRNQPPLSGTAYQKIALACRAAPPDLLVPRLQEVYTFLEKQQTGPTYRARLLLVGAQVDNLAYLEAVESCGGMVVGQRQCTSPPAQDLRISGSTAPVEAIARLYLSRVTCPRMMEAFDLRVTEIRQAAEACRADGVIISHIKFCDTWGIEAGMLARELRCSGLPALNLEREYRMTGEGQLKTRVQAFLESMGK